MPLTKDEIDAVSMVLRVNGDTAFSILLTRGGLTKRMGSSDATERSPILVTGSTEDSFERFLDVLPEHLLERGGSFEDGGREGPRHDWQFEFGGGMNSLIYDIAYHWGSASLPDDFADMVLVAERLTHAWYLKGVAEETGAPVPEVAERPVERAAPAVADAPRPASTRPGKIATAPGKRAPPLPLKRERLALVVLLDLFALSIPYSFVHWLVVGGDARVGPPGGGLALFAIVEFVLLQVARRSPGYWLLGITAPLGGKPTVDPVWPTRESPATLATGIASCGLGVAGLTAWTTYHTAVPYFGIPFPLWLSIPLTLIGSLALILAGVLMLRLEVRGTWIGAGVALLMLLSGAVGWGDWGAFVETALSNWGAYVDRPVGEGLLGLLPDVVPPLLVAVPAALAAGLYQSWKRLGRPALPEVQASPTPS